MLEWITFGSIVSTFFISPVMKLVASQPSKALETGLNDVSGRIYC